MLSIETYQSQCKVKFNTLGFGVDSRAEKSFLWWYLQETPGAWLQAVRNVEWGPTSLLIGKILPGRRELAIYLHRSSTNPSDSHAHHDWRNKCSQLEDSYHRAVPSVNRMTNLTHIRKRVILTIPNRIEPFIERMNLSLVDRGKRTPSPVNILVQAMKSSQYFPVIFPFATYRDRCSHLLRLRTGWGWRRISVWWIMDWYEFANASILLCHKWGHCPHLHKR